MSENRIRITEAIEYAKSQGRKIKKMDLAGKVFTFTSQRSAVVRLINYEKGHSTNIDRQKVGILCKELGVDANYLFGTDPMSNLNTQKKDGREQTGS